MALVLLDRAKETTTTTGTGTVTLLGAVTGFQSLAGVGNGNTTYYCIADQSGANWEVGLGTYSTTGPTLARTTVLASSNAGAAVTFTAGTKDVFVTYPAEKGVWLDASGAPVGIYPGAGITVSTGSAWGTPLTAPSGTIVGTTDTQTLTNKRVTPRVGTTTGAASPITPTADTADEYTVTALAVAATIAIPSGTPTDGQKLTLRIKDNGTARALTWTTSAGGYRIVGTTLPTTTFISKTVYVGCVYNAADSFWDVVAVSQQA